MIVSNHENEMKAERIFEDFFEWLNSSPCRFLLDIHEDDEEVEVYFYPMEEK